MSFLSSPRFLYITRIVQSAFGLGALILVCYSDAHRGWWNNITGAVAVAVITSIFTFALTGYTLFTTHRRANPFNDKTVLRTALRIGIEFIVFLLWIATVVLMLRPKGGCHIHAEGIQEVTNKRIDGCWKGDAKTTSDFIDYYSHRPLTEWNLGIAFAFVEIISFVLTIFLVWRDDRSGRASGGTTYGA